MARAIRLYELNTAVSEALYTPLQVLEVALRNAFSRVLAEEFGTDWYDANGVIVTIKQRQKINDAKLNMIIEKKEITSGRVIASLTFGFRTALLSRQYERTLWIRCLHRAFKHAPAIPKLRAVNSIITPIRILRNRVAHHEPILSWNLPKHHEKMLELTHWLSPEAARWVRQQSRFPAVHGQGPHWPGHAN